jgi:hypothetical protein
MMKVQRVKMAGQAERREWNKFSRVCLSRILQSAAMEAIFLLSRHFYR